MPLDQIRARVQVADVKAGLVTFLGLLVIQCRAADPPSRETPLPSIATEERSPALSLTLDKPRQLSIGKKWKLRGPWVSVFKGGSAKTFPKRLVQLINPFARSDEPTGTSPRYSSADFNPRAWSSIVGWHPTASTFPDPMTHEGNFGGITVSR